jgi:hypothetical protein
VQKTITAIRFYSQDNMTESDTGQDSKNQSGTKNPDRNLPDFFNRQMAFNTLHLNHLQQVRCCCWCKVKNSESKSQRLEITFWSTVSCCCWCKVKNSESKSQRSAFGCKPSVRHVLQFCSD